MLTFFHATQVFQDQRPNTTAMRVVVQLHCGAHRVNLAHKKKGGGPHTVMEGSDSYR